MGKVKRIKCIKCEDEFDAVISSIKSTVVLKPIVSLSAKRNNDKVVKVVEIVQPDTEHIKDFDDYIILFCNKGHRNKIFLKNNKQ